VPEYVPLLPVVPPPLYPLLPLGAFAAAGWLVLL
jgi:hypothetical protein